MSHKGSNLADIYNGDEVGPSGTENCCRIRLRERHRSSENWANSVWCLMKYEKNKLKTCRNIGGRHFGSYDRRIKHR